MKKVYVKPSMKMMSVDSQAMLAGSGEAPENIDVVLSTNGTGVVEVSTGFADSKDHHGSSVWDD